MSEANNENKFMTEAEISALSVRSLSNRPNDQSGRYGRKGLTPEELKAAFSALPEAIAKRLNERLPEMMAAVGELDARLKAEIEAALAGKLGRIEQSYSGSNITYAYGVDSDGETKLIKGVSVAAANTLVYRDDHGFFVVRPPEKGGNPVSKTYFDTKSNNSLYPEVTDVERRLRALEHAASGNIYETVTLSGTGTALQVDNACPYGILTRLGGNVAKINVGVPFNLAGSANISPNSLNSFDATSERSVYISCSVPSGVSATVYCYGLNGSVVSKFALASGAGSAYVDTGIGRNGLFYAGDEVVATQNNTYIYVDRTGSEFANFRVMLSNYETANIYGDVDELEIPAEIRALTGYGEAGAYIDFGERKFYDAGGVATDVSEYLPVEFDVISLLPSAIVKFTDASGNAVTADYELSYKNRI